MVFDYKSGTLKDAVIVTIEKIKLSSFIHLFLYPFIFNERKHSVPGVMNSRKIKAWFWLSKESESSEGSYISKDLLDQYDRCLKIAMMKQGGCDP